MDTMTLAKSYKIWLFYKIIVSVWNYLKLKNNILMNVSKTAKLKNKIL